MGGYSMQCEIYARIEGGKLIACGAAADVSLIFLDGSIKAVCPECFYEQVTESAAVGFILADGWRVDFDVQSNKQN